MVKLRKRINAGPIHPERYSKVNTKRRRHYGQLTAAALLGCLLLLATVIRVHALDDVPSLHCGADTIAIGNSQYATRKACGPPDKIIISGGGAVERWVYNFGPNEFIHYLDFIHGRLERIQVGEYGFIED
jgi:hypothetical protein